MRLTGFSSRAMVFQSFLLSWQEAKTNWKEFNLQQFLNNYNFFSSFTYSNNYTALTVELPYFHTCVLFFSGRHPAAADSGRPQGSLRLLWTLQPWLWNFQPPGYPPGSGTRGRGQYVGVVESSGVGLERVERSSSVTVCGYKKVLKITGQARRLWLVCWRCSEVLLGMFKRLGDTDEIPKETYLHEHEHNHPIHRCQWKDRYNLSPKN